MDCRLKHSFNLIISAPTKSGKTELVKRIIENAQEMISPPPNAIYWCYTEWQPSYETLKSKVRFFEGFPVIEELKQNKHVPKLIVFDDMMHEMKSDERFTQLFTRGSHHWNLSIIHIVQNVFYDGLRTSRINAQYIILMKNPSDALQVQTLCRQIFNGSKHFIEAYEDATNEPYGYLLIDLTQTTPDNMRLRTQIFPDDPYQFVYVQNK